MLLNMKPSIEDCPEKISEGQIKRNVTEIVRIIKKRNRTKLSEFDRRLFSNMVGFMLGAIKKQINDYNLDGI